MNPSDSHLCAGCGALYPANAPCCPGCHIYVHEIGHVAALRQLGIAAIARVGAWINLFNLLPIWQLDGGRGFNALNRRARWLAAGAIGAAWFFSEESLLLLLLIGAGFRALTGQAPEQTDRYALWVYVSLIAAFSSMTMIEVPGITR